MGKYLHTYERTHNLNKIEHKILQWPLKNSNLKVD